MSVEGTSPFYFAHAAETTKASSLKKEQNYLSVKGTTPFYFAHAAETTHRGNAIG
ncbi:MAG: hypothetical protein PHG10_03330 [Sulfurimonas sp.]|nr:hypothetical protein [Sulfurimonas sp.]